MATYNRTGKIFVTRGRPLRHLGDSCEPAVAYQFKFRLMIKVEAFTSSSFSMKLNL